MKLCQITIGKKFNYQGKVYIKTSHNRGVCFGENKQAQYIQLKKYTKVESVEKVFA